MAEILDISIITSYSLHNFTVAVLASAFSLHVHESLFWLIDPALISLLVAAPMPRYSRMDLYLFIISLQVYLFLVADHGDNTMSNLV